MTEFKRPPFGVKVERFATLGYHPRFESRPGTFKYTKIFPGCYEWSKSRRIVSKVPRWKRQSEVEEFSRRLGYTNERVLKRRKWFKSINGPGWQDVSSLTLDAGVKFPKAVRFPTAKFKAFAVPGPGTYGKYHIPFTRKEEKSREKGFSFSKVPSFEQYSKAPRSLNVEIPYHLPPNLYAIKSFADEIISKRISKRGPYDLFTAERFPDPAVPKLSVLRPGLHPSNLNHPKNAFKGIFQKCGKTSIITSRLALKDIALAKKNPSDPGPSYYDPYSTLPVKQASAPFNSSVKEVRPAVKCGFSPPPGRYSQSYKRPILGNGMRSAFLSKTSSNAREEEDDDEINKGNSQDHEDCSTGLVKWRLWSVV